MRAPALPRGREGFTLVEVLVASIIVAMIGAAIAAALSAAFQAWSWSDRKSELVQRGRFAIDRMVFWTRMTNRVLIPFQYRYKDVGIARDVLAVAGCGQSAFDADGDGLYDEDTGADATNDGASGIVGIDDDGNGQTDEASSGNDDEDKLSFWQWTDEDALDGAYTAIGLWADLDYWVDEDWGADMNGDNKPGVSGVDDDGDWSVDEGSSQNDDEDTTTAGVERINEDPISPFVWYLDKTATPWSLVERSPLTGTNVIATGVTAFSVTRTTNAEGGHQIAISLTLADADGETLTFSTTVRPRNQARLYIPDA